MSHPSAPHPAPAAAQAAGHATASSTAAPADPASSEGCEVYRLYVSSASPISARAIVNARRFLQHHLPGAHRLTVLDIGRHVASAREDQIVASPTLVRLLPRPQRRFIGDISDTERLRVALGLPRRGAG